MSTALQRGWLGSWLCGVLFAAAVLLLVPVGTAYQLGADEGYELMKGYLCSSGYHLYGAFWNDQPPFHTGLLTILFTLFGPSLLAARLLALLFGSLCVGLLSQLLT